MEYYKGKLLANISSLRSNRKPNWFSHTRSITKLGGKGWASKFYIWRMDLDSRSISLFMDGMLMNKTLPSQLDNYDRSGIILLSKNIILLLNLALSGINGGEPGEAKFHNRIEVDYVRVYQKTIH